MYCGKCGKEISDNSKFCNHCGATIANAQISNCEKQSFDTKNDESYKKREKQITLLIICSISLVISLIIATVMGFFVFFVRHLILGLVTLPLAIILVVTFIRLIKK